MPYPCSACMCAQSFQLHLILYNPMDCSPPGSSVHELSRQDYWSGLPCPPLGDLPDPGMEPTSALQVDSLPTEPPGKPILVVCVLSLSVVYLEHTLYDVNPKFIETCFMDKATVYLGKYSICILKEYIFCCCWMGYYINVYLVKLTDCVAWVLYILTDFLTTCSINYY